MLTDDDIHYSATRLKEKGTAWDYIAHWVPKMITRFTPMEIVQMYEKVKTLNLNYGYNNFDKNKFNKYEDLS